MRSFITQVMPGCGSMVMMNPMNVCESLVVSVCVDLRFVLLMFSTSETALAAIFTDKWN